MKKIQSIFKRYQHFILFIFLIFNIILNSSVAQAVVDCNNISNIPESWKNHFPFDLVYPVGLPVSPASSCPIINFWGQDREVCSIKQLTAILKNIFLLKVAIQGLINL